MTYLVTYYLHHYSRGTKPCLSLLYQKRGSFVVDGETCEAATTKAESVLRDSVDYGVKHLRMPKGVAIHISSVLPTTPKEPTWEDTIGVALKRNKEKG